MEYSTSAKQLKMAAEPIKLYYFPTSFYSQKVLIALKEKNISYSEQVVSLLSKEVNEPWFLRVNPKGQLPVLQVGSKTVTESEAIIDHVDDMGIEHGDERECRLIPAPGTAEADLVSEWRQKLNAVDAEVITFGVMLNKELHTADMRLPAWFLSSKEGFTKMQRASIPQLEKKKELNPDVAHALDIKISTAMDRSGSRYDLHVIREALDDLEVVMDGVEAQLRTSRAVNYDAHWLCGPRFTAADITLCVLLGRLDLIGYLNKIADPDKRPALAQYWKSALTRDSVASTVDVITALKAYFMRKMINRVAWGTLVAGAVVMTGGILARVMRN